MYRSSKGKLTILWLQKSSLRRLSSWKWRQEKAVLLQARIHIDTFEGVVQWVLHQGSFKTKGRSECSIPLVLPVFIVVTSREWRFSHLSEYVGRARNRFLRGYSLYTYLRANIKGVRWMLSENNIFWTNFSPFRHPNWKLKRLRFDWHQRNYPKLFWCFSFWMSFQAALPFWNFREVVSFRENLLKVIRHTSCLTRQ